MAEIISIEEELAQRGRCFQQTNGTSMEPLLHAHYSTVVLEPLAGLPRKNDVVLYRRPDGVYVLHRVLKTGEESCLFRGDNCLGTEIVPNSWLVGVMTGFFNGETYTSCGDSGYLQYIKTLNRRYAVRWCRALPGRVKRKLFSWIAGNRFS